MCPAYRAAATRSDVEITHSHGVPEFCDHVCVLAGTGQSEASLWTDKKLCKATVFSGFQSFHCLGSSPPTCWNVTLGGCSTLSVPSDSTTKYESADCTPRRLWELGKGGPYLLWGYRNVLHASWAPFHLSRSNSVTKTPMQTSFIRTLVFFLLKGSDVCPS